MNESREEAIKTDKLKIAEKLKHLRGDRTQDEVAEALETTVSAISNYEQGIRIPRDEMKKKLAEYYGKTVQEIFFA